MRCNTAWPVSELRTNVASSSRTRVYGNDDTALVSEGKSGRSMLNLDPARRVR